MSSGGRICYKGTLAYWEDGCRSQTPPVRARSSCPAEGQHSPLNRSDEIAYDPMWSKHKHAGRSEEAFRELETLVQLACRSGASCVGILRPGDVPVEDRLADVCLETRCEGYSLSCSCPPNVSGPQGFRELTKNMQHALVIRIDIPQAAMFSEERHEIFWLLHTTVSTLERAAVELGYTESSAFAAGSCKKIFCRSHAACRRVSEGGTCRNPQHARPSMSGFGINVSKMLKIAGCDQHAPREGQEPDAEPMTWVAGLLLVG